MLKGGITGIIQTTGIWIDPIKGLETAVNADLGQLLYKNGKVVGVTTISSKLAISGQIISRGDLISSITAGAGFSGVIAAQGNIGAILQDADGDVITTNGQLTRFGGITITGNDSGQIIALGKIFCDLSIKGQLTGRIAANGAAVSGIDSSRSGILGNIKVKSAFSQLLRCFRRRHWRHGRKNNLQLRCCQRLPGCEWDDQPGKVCENLCHRRAPELGRRCERSGN